MFFTYSRVQHYFENCTLKYDVGPYKKGDNLDYILRIPGTYTFVFYDYGSAYSDSLYKMSLRKFIRVHSSARKIQRAWRRCISDPSHEVCRKRLLDEYKEVPKRHVSREMIEVTYDFGAELNEQMPRVPSYHLKTSRTDEYEYEPELPGPLGKRIFF